MKQSLLILLFFALFTFNKASAQFAITDLNNEGQHSDVSIVDWDNDGDLDILISGETGADTSYRINRTAYLNNGSGTYTPVSVPFTPISRGAFHWNDVNQDGKIDLLENGFGLGIGAYAKIYNSDGSGMFTENPLALPQMSPSSGFADFNNDGYVDIYVFGNGDQGTSKILLNNKAGGFDDSHALDAFAFHIDPDVSVVDFDNDKDLDIFVTDREFDPNNTKHTRLFKNDNGVFTETQFDTRGEAIGYGSSTWGDYDGDGFLDVLVNGDGPNNAYFSYKLYKNNGGTSFNLVDSFHYGQFSTGGGGRFLDWDNDGDLDFVVTGWTGQRQATAVYLNTAGIFTEMPTNATLPGFSECSIEVGDLDNDTRLDLVLSGFSGNDFDGAGTDGPYNRNISVVVKNPSLLPNLPPTAPTSLSATGNQALVTLNWAAATDLTTPQNALSYNIYVVDANGKWFYYPLADTTTGKLKQQKFGNVNLNKGWIIKGLPVGTYHWGVQAIDNSFMGSTFAKSTFIINADGTLPIHLTNYFVKAEGKKSKIEWTTASEQNNNRFDVERSSNGRDFFRIATITGNGTTAEANNYFVYDNNPSKGINYYRLIQYNLDGKSTNFGIKTVAFSTALNAIAITYPNPSTKGIGIRLSNYEGKTLTVVMTDLSGKQIHKEQIQTSNGQGYYELHLNSKPIAGQYLLSLTGEGLRETLKVIMK